MAQTILELICSLLQIWLNLHLDDISVQRLSAAMTNSVFIVTNRLSSASATASCDEGGKQWEEPERLLLRVYGDSTWMFDRSVEESVAECLSKDGVIPKWHGVFGNGRFEEFLPNVPVSALLFRTTRYQEMIAHRLAMIHLSLGNIIESTGILAKDSLWSRLSLWTQHSQVAFNQLENSILTPSHRQYLSDIGKLGVFSEDLPGSLRNAAELTESPLVFGHCDVQILPISGLIHLLF